METPEQAQTEEFDDDFLDADEEDSDEAIPAEPTPEDAVLATRPKRRLHPLSFPKTRPSTIDIHPQRGLIERAILRGKLSTGQLAKKYKLSESAVTRHRKRLFAQLEEAEQIRAKHRADRKRIITEELDSVRQEVRETMREARTDKEYKSVAALAGQAIGGLRLSAEIDGVIGGAEQGQPGAGGLNLTQVNIEKLIAVPKARKDKPGRVVDITPTGQS